ncbi:MAG: nucleotidyltransferase domain-containing protein [Planctomycetes bacterium]|nr:nucleotidyltransferase domain-containing protein [Planctomycetota bacterium]
MAEFWEDNLVLRTLSGSRAHGLAREGSDTDTRGVCIPPARYLLGLSKFEQHESDGGDHVTYALAKFVRLALQGNPNIMESLFTHEDDFLFVNEAGRQLVEARDLFLSKQVGQRFMGYALDQLKRMERHHRWLVDPPKTQPQPSEYGANDSGGRYRFPDTDQQKAYDADLKHWHHYQTWRKERNPERAVLEDRHGYDTKHAMHLIRLLKMGEEVLSKATLIVRRPDAEWLLGIRDGGLDYESLLQLAEEMTSTLNDQMKESTLPDGPDQEAAEALLVSLHHAAITRETS